MSAALPFEGQRILITGAGAGIGAITAQRLVDQGARIAILDRDGDAARRTAEVIGRDRSLAWTGDVTELAPCEEVLAAMEASWGGIDSLVNNAGTWDHGALLELSVDSWRRVLEVNLIAPIVLSNLVARRMRSGGAIVNVSSVLGQVVAPGRGPYCVSKSALITLTKLQAVEWAPRAIRVNAIAPGYIANETTDRMAADGGFDVAAINRRTPMGRFGTQFEIAEGIAFLLDPARASYVTGHVLEVNGGWTAYGYV